MFNSIKMKIGPALLTLSLSNLAYGLADLDLGASVMSFSADHSSGGTSGLSSSGVAITFNWFSSMTLAVRGKFTSQFSPEEFTNMIIGGSGGFAYYPLGGQSFSVKTEDLRIKATPQYNLFIYGGVASYTYDLRTVIDAPERAATGKKESVSRTGDFLGIEAMIGYEYFLSFLEQESKLIVNFSWIQSLNPPEEYTMTLLQAVVGVGISL